MLQLFDGNGVIFVNDGNHTVFKKPGKGVGNVLAGAAFLHNVAGEQQLCDLVPVFGEKLIIDVHKGALSDGGSCLLVGKGGGLSGETELVNTDTHGAGGNDDDLAAAVFKIAGGANKPFDACEIEASAGMGQGRSTDLDDDTLVFLKGHFENTGFPFNGR